MGLDVALGVIILIAAIRGWLQGFVYQTIRLAGLVACIFLAEPVRDQAKPHVMTYLPAIPAEIVDRLLWWVSAVFSYVVIVGVTSLVIKMTRRPEIPGIRPDSPRNDQFAGFLLGAAKGVLIAAFMTAGIQKYAIRQVGAIPWADQQVKTSQALRWNEQYQPASKIWLSQPVQQLVNRVKYMGLQRPGNDQDRPNTNPADQPVLQTASKPIDAEERKSLRPRDVSRNASAESQSNKTPKLMILDPDIETAIEEINSVLDMKSKPSN